MRGYLTTRVLSHPFDEQIYVRRRVKQGRWCAVKGAGSGVWNWNLVVWCQSRHVEAIFAVCQGVRMLSPDIFVQPVFFFFFLIPFIIFLHLLSLLPTRNSDPGSHSRLFSPLPATVRAFIFVARRFQPFSSLVNSHRNPDFPDFFFECKGHSYGRTFSHNNIDIFLCAIFQCSMFSWFIFPNIYIYVKFNELDFFASSGELHE